MSDNWKNDYTEGKKFTLGNGDSYVVMSAIYDGTQGQIIACKLTISGKPHKTLRGLFRVSEITRRARLVENYKAGSL